jgi:hypothetical protein
MGILPRAPPFDGQFSRHHVTKSLHKRQGYAGT